MKNNKYILILGILFALTVLSACNKTDEPEAYVVLGQKNAQKQWVYLCGLATSFDVPQEVLHRNILDQVGRQLGIGFLAVKPKERSAHFDNMLCWPHDTQDEIEQTSQMISDALGNRPVAGFIGFSNGGFFLNRLAQLVELDVPIISIAAAGYSYSSGVKNRLYLMIGKHDPVYQLVRDFLSAAEKSSLTVQLIEYEGGHEILFQPLCDLLKTL